ncbi:MAG TPA: hypothetical protein DGH68_12115, partial [Bacteroidetes bacterium]|nr:hypothetical protein [Bacteroidota bacterium]
MWSARYDSPEKGTDYPLLIALDPSGSVYVTGYSSGSQGFLPSTTLKYDADGSQRWAVRYGIGFTPLCMQVDRSGNIYVGGFPGLVKYDNQGNQLWSTTDVVSAMTLDRQGTLYFSTSTGIIKVDSMGVRQALIDSSATDIAVDDSGSVYLTLYDGGQFTKKYSPSGSLLWSYSFGGTQIRLDRFGNAIVKRPYGSMLAFKLTPAG